MLVDVAHATQDRDALARDLRKLAMLAVPLGIKIAYEGLSWGRTINEFPDAWDIVCRADAPNLGIGIDSFHAFADQVLARRPRHAVDPDKIFLVQLADFMWQEIRTVEERITTARHFRVFPGEGVHSEALAELVHAARRARLPRRLQLRGVQRRLQQLPLPTVARARAPVRDLARRRRAAPLGAVARRDAAEGACGPGGIVTHAPRPCMLRLFDRVHRRAAMLLATLAFGMSGAAHAVDLQGHRGARGLAPENTLRAFEVALQHGVTTLELDIAITRDGVLVIHHDLALNPAFARDAQGRGCSSRARRSTP